MKEKIRRIIYDQLAEWCMPQTTLIMKKEDKVKFAYDLADAIYELIEKKNED